MSWKRSAERYTAAACFPSAETSSDHTIPGWFGMVWETLPLVASMTEMVLSTPPAKSDFRSWRSRPVSRQDIPQLRCGQRPQGETRSPRSIRKGIHRVLAYAVQLHRGPASDETHASSTTY